MDTVAIEDSNTAFLQKYVKIDDTEDIRPGETMIINNQSYRVVFVLTDYDISVIRQGVIH